MVWFIQFFPLANECTVGNITRVTISDDAFPFGYDATQFGHCLSAQVVKENLASLTEKVDVDEFQRVILDRLDEVAITKRSREAWPDITDYTHYRCWSLRLCMVSILTFFVGISIRPTG